MPRNAQGLYVLPAGNPVTPGTIIESVWANTTMSDLADAMTGSLPRDGSAPMTGPLTLNGAVPSSARHAVSKAYVDQFMAYSSGMPIGSVSAFGGSVAPAGWLKCDGSTASRTTYADLFALVGTTYGAGDGSTTFNLPDLRNEFIRGRPDSRPVGDKQTASFASHTHAVSDPTHAHAQPAHSHSVTTVAHSHGVSDPGHAHNFDALSGSNTTNANQYHNMSNNASAGQRGVTASPTGISIATAAPTGSTNSQQPAIAAAATGISLGTAGGTETVPQNMALDYYIKAVHDAAGIPSITGIDTSDANMISVDNTLPNVPTLVIHSNVPFGIPKLDASGKLLLNQLPTSSQQLLGYFDASGGQNPSEVYPSEVFVSGDTYIVSVEGTITVYSPVTLTPSVTLVTVGGLLQYVSNSVTNPTGWYFVAAVATTQASQVGFTPAGSIGATNVQDAIVELDGDVTTNSNDIFTLQGDVANLTLDLDTKVAQTDATGAAVIPTGTTAERPLPTDGLFRYNSELAVFEGYSNSAWGQVGGGQMVGSAQTKAIFFNAITIAENLTIAAGTNGGSFGPVEVANGFEVTVPNGSNWSIV